MNRDQSHIEFLDYLRGVAIIAVFLFHLVLPVSGINILPWGTWFPHFTAPTSFWLLFPLSFGWCGVAMFFVISGFCIHLSFRRKPDWFDFMARRFFRIYPAYLAALVICALLIPWTRIPFSWSGAVQLFSHLALVQNFGASTFHGINVAFWSIAVEIQLYLLYPVLLLLVSRFGWQRALVYIAILEIGLRSVAGIYLVSTEEIPLPLLGLPFIYWFSWSVGAFIAEAHVSKKPVPFASHSPLLWGVVAIGSLFIKPMYSFGFMFFSLMTAAMIGKLLCQRPMAINPIKLPAWFINHVRTAGLWSYSIYLLHAPFLYGACAPTLSLHVAAKLHLFDLPHPLIYLCGELGMWPFILMFAMLSYRFIELPGIALGKQLVKKVGWQWGNKTRLATV